MSPRAAHDQNKRVAPRRASPTVTPMPQNQLHPELAAILNQYQEIVSAWQTGAIDPAEGAARLEALVAHDLTGAAWKIDPADGMWKRYDGTSWVVADPSQFRTVPAAPAPVPSGDGFDNSGFGNVLDKVTGLPTEAQEWWSKQDPEKKRQMGRLGGAGLVLGGIFGNPLRSGDGIGGLLVGTVMGLIFVLIGLFVLGGDDVRDGYVTAEAVVVATEACGSGPDYRDDDGGFSSSGTWRAVYEFTVGNETYQVRGGICSSSHPTVGDTATVAYPPQDPSSGHPVGEAKMLRWAFVGMGGLVAAVSGFKLLQRLAMIGGGIWLWLKNRRQQP